MPGFTNIGTQPGEALPAGGTGANGIWTPPGYLLFQDLGVAWPSTTTSAETTLLSAARTYPAAVAIGDTIEIDAAGYYKSTGASNIPTFNFYMGATIIAALVFPTANANASQKNWQLQVKVPYTVVTAGAGNGAVRPIVSGSMAGAGTGMQGLVSAGGNLFNDGAAVTPAGDVSTALAFDLKASLSSGTATVEVRCNILQARYFPKNG